jgi:MurNAc alpha-1-phosphate uridylyltransferase
MQENKVSGEYFSGDWRDIGTPERLQKLNEEKLVIINQ